MKPPAFSYHLPTTIEEAVGSLGALENAKLLAGGQSLMPMLNMRFVQPDHLIDLNRIESLSGVVRDKDRMRVGAMTRQRTLEFDPNISRWMPLMHEAILNVGHRQTRNRGTLGGSLCHLDPAAELVAVAAAHDAVIEVAGPKGRREIAFCDFCLAFMSPAIGFDEIVTGASFQIWPPEHGSAFTEFSRRHGDFALASAAALIHEDSSGRILRASLTIGGVSQSALRMREAEVMLTGETASPALFRAAAERCRDIDALEDAHVSSAYRRRLATNLARHALETAHQRHGGATTSTET